MMNIRFTILSAMAFFALGEAQAQKAWSLRQCIDYALEHNITVKQMQNIREQQALQLNTNKNSRLPDLNASVGENISFGRGLTAQNTYEDRTTSSTSAQQSLSSMATRRPTTYVLANSILMQLMPT